MTVFVDNIFENQVALVTGGTSGIGSAIATSLAAHGCTVVAVGLPGSAAGVGGNIRTVGADLTSQEAVENVIGSLDRLDILVNCAGMIARAEEHRLDVFERVIAVNLTATMRMSSACRPLLGRQGGAIVNIVSMLSYFGGALVPAYSASKGGVAQLTKSLALAYAADGIRVNAVAPGWIKTPLTGALQEDPVRSQAILDRTPLGRWGTPEDVAKVVTFICSQGAGFVTGTVLPVDGGYLIA